MTQDDLIEILIIVVGFFLALGFLLWIDPNCNLSRLPH